MNRLRERIRSKQSLDVGAGTKGPDDPVSPREDKGKIRSPRSGETSRESSPKTKDLNDQKSPGRHRRDTGEKPEKTKEPKAPTVVVAVTEGGEELVSLGKSPAPPLESKRLSKRDLLEKLQGKPLLIAKADLPEQLYCWGEGFVRNADTFTASRYFRVSSGPMHSAAIMDNGTAPAINQVLRIPEGVLYVWGKNASGQLGTGNTESLDFPTVVPFLAEKKVRAVACGGAQTLVLTEQHELYQFGYDGFQSHRLPVLIEPAFAHSGRKVASIAAGPTHSALITDNGELYTWGQGGKGQLGYDADKKERPTLVDRFATKPVREVSCGTTHTCVITVKNTLWVFGEFSVTTEMRKPHKIVSAVQPEGGILLRHDSKLKRVTSSLIRNEAPQKNVKVQAVVCGLHFTVLVTDEGELWAFGENRHGELGQGNLEPSDQPKRIDALKEPVIALGCGQTHVLAITASHELWGWGGTGHQVLGAAMTEENQMTPIRLRNLRGKVPMQVVGTGACTIARMRQGLFGAPLTDLIVAGELPHRLASLFAYLELDEHISHSNVIQSYGFSAEKKRLQNLLDLGTELNLGEYSLNTVASALQAFFRDLPDSLLTYRHFSDFLKAADAPTELLQVEGFRSAILQLPKENVTLLSRLLSFFSKALAKAETRSNFTPTTVATVFAPLILREPSLPGAEQLAVIPAQVVRAVALLIEIGSVALQRDPAEVLNILLKKDLAAKRPRREVWSNWVAHLDRHLRMQSGNGSQLFTDILLRSNAPRYLLESIMDRCYPAESEDLRLFNRLVEIMFHVDVDAEKFNAALRQLSLAALNEEQRETILSLFLSFEKASAGQLEDVSHEMSKILKQKEQDEKLEESLRDSHRLIVTLTTVREILKKESMARLRVIHANAPRIQSLVDEAARQQLQLKAELQDQESKLAKIVTKELLQFNDINERTDELRVQEKQLAARKAALEAELARVTEQLNSVRTQLRQFESQKDAAVHVQAEEQAKVAVERTKDRLQSQKLFAETLTSCHAYNEKLLTAFQSEEKNLQRRLDESTTQCVQALMLHLELIEQVFQNMMDKLRRANAMLGDTVQQPRYIVREYNRERQLFDQFSSAYEDFKAGAVPLLESLEKDRPERSAEIAEKITELDRFKERIARSFSEIS